MAWIPLCEGVVILFTIYYYYYKITSIFLQSAAASEGVISAPWPIVAFPFGPSRMRALPFKHYTFCHLFMCL